MNTNSFFLKLFVRLRDIPAKSRDIPPKKFGFPGFEGHSSEDFSLLLAFFLVNFSWLFRGFSVALLRLEKQRLDLFRGFFLAPVLGKIYAYSPWKSLLNITELFGPPPLHVENPHPARGYPDPKVWVCALFLARRGRGTRTGPLAS